MEEIKTKSKCTLEILGVSPEIEVTVLKLPSIECEEYPYYLNGQKLFKMTGKHHWLPFTVSYKDTECVGDIFKWINTFNMSTFDMFRASDSVTRTGILRCSNGQVWEVENIWPQAINTETGYFNSGPLKIELTFCYSKATVNYSNATTCCSTCPSNKPQKNRKLFFNWDNK